MNAVFLALIWGGTTSSTPLANLTPKLASTSAAPGTTIHPLEDSWAKTRQVLKVAKLFILMQTKARSGQNYLRGPGQAGVLTRRSSEAAPW